MYTRMWGGWAWAGIGTMVTGVGNVVMHAVGVGTGGLDTIVSKVVAVATDIMLQRPPSDPFASTKTWRMMG